MKGVFQNRATHAPVSLFRLLLLAGVWSAAAAYGAAPSESSLNLLVNGGFELQLPVADWGCETPFWLCGPENPVKAEVVSSATAHGGQHVLRLSPAGAGKAGAVYQPVWLLGQADHPAWLLDQADHYVLEAYARGAQAQLQLQVYEYGSEYSGGYASDHIGADKIAGTKASEVFTLTDQWMRCSLEYRPGPGVKHAAVALHVIQGTAEVDDVQFVPVGDFAKLSQEIAAPPWRGNQLGLSRTVPPPFLPMKLLIGDKALTPDEGLPRPLEESFVVTCLGREYHFQGGPLPEQIRSQEADLLAAPARLLVEMSGGGGQASATPIRWGAVTLKELSDDRIVLEGVAEFAGGEGKAPLSATLTATLEFDGVIRYDLAVRPGQAVTVSRFALEIPLRRERAALYHCRTFDRSLYGLTPEGPWHSRFIPSVWLGDHSRGLCWFAEAPRGWGNKGAEDRQLEVAPSEDVLLLRANFVNAPTRLDAERTWTFGLLATPAKPLPSVPPFQHVRSDDLAHPRCAGIPINYVFVGGGEGEFMELYGVREEQKTESKQAVKLAHDKGELSVVWAQEGIVPQLPGYIENLAKRMRLPMDTWIDAQGTWVLFCPGSHEWSEMLLYGLVKQVKEYGVDGFYFDTGCVFGCRNPLHGCGYTDSEGRRQMGYPIFADREFKKRLYRALYEVLGHPPYLCTLLNENFLLPQLTFDTAVVSGEEWNRPMQGISDYRKVITPAQWSAQYYSGQWGFWSIFLPARTSKMDLASTNSFLAFSLLYNTPLWVDCCDRARVFSALDAIAVLGKGTAFVPPWEVGRLVQVTAPECKAALYKGDGRMLLVLSNFGDATTPVAVAFSPEALKGLKPELSASDALTREKLSLDGDKMTVAVPGNNFRMVLIGE